MCPPEHTTGPLSTVLVTIIVIKYQIFPILKKKKKTCPAVCAFYRNGYTRILFVTLEYKCNPHPHRALLLQTKHVITCIHRPVRKKDRKVAGLF